MINYHAVSISHTRQETAMILLIMVINNNNEDENELDLQMDDIEIEVEVVDDMTHELGDHFDHQSEGTICSRNTKLNFQLQNQPNL